MVPPLTSALVLGQLRNVVKVAMAISTRPLKSGLATTAQSQYDALVSVPGEAVMIYSHERRVWRTYQADSAAKDVNEHGAESECQ